MKQKEIYNKLLSNIKKHKPKLKLLLDEVNNDWSYEDTIYRFYHCSFKTHYIHSLTIKIVNILKAIDPKENKEFAELFQMMIDGANINVPWKKEQNNNWGKHVSPIIEAFLHTKYFLEMIIKYSTMKKAPELLPSGWAAILELYNIR
jgi:hypothetical protein